MREELRAVRWWALGYLVVLEVLLGAAVLSWPTISTKIESLKGLVPLPMIEHVLDKIADEGIAPYLNAQHFFKGCNALGAIAAVFFSMSAVAGEAHRGTLEIWLARPLSRRRILTERFAANALAVIVPVFLSTATIPWWLGQVQEELDLGPLLLCAVHQSVFLLAIYALSFLYSCLSSRPFQIAFVLLIGAIFQFALYMIDGATHWSIFRLSDVDVYDRIYTRHELPLAIVLPLVVFVAAAFELSQRAFARRTP